MKQKPGIARYQIGESVARLIIGHNTHKNNNTYENKQIRHTRRHIHSIGVILLET